MFKTLKRILDVCGKNKKRVYLGIVCSFFNAGCKSFSILAILNILINIDNLQMENIMFSTKILVGALIAKAILKYLMNSFLLASGYIVFCDKRLELGEKLKKAPMGYFSEKNLGTINTTVTSAMGDLENFAMMAVESVIGGVIQAFAISIFLTYFDYRLGIVTILGLVLGMLALNMVEKKAKELTPIRNEALGKTVDSVLSFIRGIAVIKSFGLRKENSLHNAFNDYSNACIELERKVMGLDGFFRAVLQVSGSVLLLVTSILMVQGKIEFAIGIMFMIASYMVYGQVEVIGNGAFLMQLLGDAFDRMDETYNVPIVASKEQTIPENSDIELKNVSFAYDDRQIIKNVSFKIPEKSSLAIVGYSGSGKTTICNLMVRFWDINKGEISFANKDIKNYKPDELMSKFSMVFQNVYLFNDTIENNIKFGNINATHEQVVEVAKKARCHEFIEKLPQKYNTVLGESGSTLSGGEKQRISIARAMLKNAPVIILDEATSSVDPENEHELLKAIEELTRNKTLISIAHRLSTVKNADKIIVLDDGKIVQEGRHKDLAKQEGIYKSFINVRNKTNGWAISA